MECGALPTSAGTEPEEVMRTVASITRLHQQGMDGGTRRGKEPVK